MIQQVKERGTILVYIEEGADFLASHGVPDARLSAEELLASVCSSSRLALYQVLDQKLPSALNTKYHDLLKRRSERYPLQYLLARQPFRFVSLEIGTGCLIPRPETEGLVDIVLEALPKNRPLYILDIGTGSGNISISLACERPQWSLVATDISERALAYANRNILTNGVSSRVKLVQADLFEITREPQFDALVSNPPYLTNAELESAQAELYYEPREALFGGSDGLAFYRRIISLAPQILKPAGQIFFEIGFGQAECVTEILTRAGFENTQVKKDNSEIERYVSAFWKM